MIDFVWQDLPRYRIATGILQGIKDGIELSASVLIDLALRYAEAPHIDVLLNPISLSISITVSLCRSG